MNASNPAPEPAKASANNISVKIFGVGGAGVSLIEQMLKTDFAGANFMAVNTDARALAASSAPDTLYLETKRLRGLGTGGDPERGRAVAEENLEKLKAMCAGADVVFIVTGLGGGAGTGISPVLARAAREAGALALAFVTLPFDCEGNRRQRQAQQGLQQLKAAADGVICLPNQKVFKLIDENTSIVETFKITSQLLLEGARGVWRLLRHTGLIEIHFDDLCALLRDQHTESCFAAVEAAGPARAREIVERLLAHPMLDGGQALAEADAVLVSLMGGPDLTMADVNRVMEQIGRQCEHAQMIMGAAVDEAFKERLAVTVVAARRNGLEEANAHEAEAASEDSAGADAPGLDTQLLNRTATTRRASRFVPPPPSLTPEQRDQFLAKQPGANSRQRKKSARLRQTQLPLEIISKGRFDKSEPTIHKGEDLDVPTYIRRGVALN